MKSKKIITGFITAALTLTGTFGINTTYAKASKLSDPGDVYPDYIIDTKKIDDKEMVYKYASGSTTAPYLIGDVNFDGKVTVTDISIVASYVTRGLPPLTPGQVWAIDVNFDGKWNVTDIAIVSAKVKGIR